MPVEAGKQVGPQFRGLRPQTVTLVPGKVSSLEAIYVAEDKQRQMTGAISVDHQVTGLAIVQNPWQASPHGQVAVRLSIENSGADSEPMLY